MCCENSLDKLTNIKPKSYTIINQRTIQKKFWFTYFTLTKQIFLANELAKFSFKTIFNSTTIIYNIKFISTLKHFI